MNFNQWKTYAAKNDVARVTYVCGSESTLIELVIDDIVRILQVPVTDFISIDATSAVWELASQYPLDPDANRLILVRDADKIADWTGLDDWLSNMRSNPKNHLLFVSYLPDAPGIFQKGKKVTYAEHIELIKTKGKFIKCSVPNDDDLIVWAESFGLSRVAAEFLVSRTSGDTSTMLNVLKKIHVWDGSPSPKALSLLCDELALDSFADYLITQDKVSALLSLQIMSQDDKLRALTWLDFRLSAMYEIAACVRKRMYDGDIAATTGIKIFLIKKLKPAAKNYDDKKIKFCRQLVAMTDAALRDGAKVGVMESLVALW